MIRRRGSVWSRRVTISTAVVGGRRGGVGSIDGLLTEGMIVVFVVVPRSCWVVVLSRVMVLGFSPRVDAAGLDALVVWCATWLGRIVAWVDEDMRAGVS